ncbi:MAG: hypothetical protein ACJ795_11470 [Ktedonobacteraceae bacterium]
MSIINTPLFASRRQRKIGVGFHNVGSGVLRASDAKTMKKVEIQYGERCGHIPLDAQQAQVLVDGQTGDIQAHMRYLSQLYGKEIRSVTADVLTSAEHVEDKALVVPYINVPEAERRIEGELGAESWGLPGKMVTLLKNKADFYQLIDEFNLAGYQTPDYSIVQIGSLAAEALGFLSKIENIIKTADVPNYPLGVMMRAAESDGNYGCCLVYEIADRVIVVRDGEAEHAESYSNWHEALAVSQRHLATTMNEQRESRVVISRFVDMADSPGMSVVIIDGQVESLRWNGQLQKAGSKACVGTSSYRPKDAYVARLQQEYEEQTVAVFETILRKTARRCGIDFASLRGIANIDLMLPSPLELLLQKRRGQQSAHYLAECNPRWTNYTDAIMTIIGVQRREQTIQNMRTVIAEGISTIDKYYLPEHVDPKQVRALLLQSDEALKQDGTRIICRMAKNPMGLIFAGDVARGEQEVAKVVREAASFF